MSIRSVRITTAHQLVGRSGTAHAPLRSVVVTSGAQGPRGERGLVGTGKTGAPGPEGPQGGQGPQGDQGPAGRDAVRWRRDFNEATPYGQGDGVRASDGLLYVSTVDENTGHDPVGDSAHWQPLAATPPR